MKVISDDIHRLKRLDHKYDKLVDPADAEKKQRIGDKITKVRDAIVTELDKQKERIDKHKANYLDENGDGKSSDKVMLWDKYLAQIDEKIKEIDSIVDPSLIAKDGEKQASDETNHSANNTEAEPESNL